MSSEEEDFMQEEDRNYNVDNLLQQIREDQDNVTYERVLIPTPDLSLNRFLKQEFPLPADPIDEAKLSLRAAKRNQRFGKYRGIETQIIEREKQDRKNESKIALKLAGFFNRLFSMNPSPVEQFVYDQHHYEPVDVFQQRKQIGFKTDSFQPPFIGKLPMLSYDFEDAYRDQKRAEARGTAKKKQKKTVVNTQSEYLTTVFQQEMFEEVIECGDVRKAWQVVVKNVVKVGRFKAKYRSDLREFIKRVVYLAAKEVRRKHLKCQKYQKDFMLRAKKLSKDSQSFWRKRDKELIEVKKRKEKLEQEKKKKEEEEKEQVLQQRRLDFLMKQSDIYAHFMAKKLGITLEQHMSNIEDENQAIENVQRIINDNRKQLQQFDGQKQSEVTLKELKLDHIDQEQNQLMHPPSSFHGELKEYQLKGLRWLDNLYEQGINGILADEMGLGKTIQAIALLSHISQHKLVYGPFLVIAPSSTLHNWQQEIRKFCPSLKVLPYWGQSIQRKTIRKYFNQKNFGFKESLFHIVVTSYNLVVTDNKIFHRVKWQYMILDEAQAIKNINSQRWSVLLSFNARNRLLLTGTPIQNTMGELWALLHFIMPKFFDSFEQFQEWFSKDIEAHSQDQKTLNQHQLQRLHSILKPFMLRRLKKDVENEIGQKKEVQLTCEMTSRQAALYKNIKSKLSIKEFFRMLDSKQKVDNLMNLVMQFRKICNHPELFERKPYKSPYVFQDKYSLEGSSIQTFVTVRQRNPIKFVIPKIVYDELLNVNTRLQLFTAHYIIQSLKRKENTFALLDIMNINPNCFQANDFDLVYINTAKFLKPQHQIKLDQQKYFIITIPNAQSQIIDIQCRSSSFYNAQHQYLYSHKIPIQAQFIIPNSPESLIAQSSKLLQLDKLLKELKNKQWRVLIFCQMTKMLDILEEYMLFRGYTYFRMDGQCQINDRRDMVNEFQKNDKIFAFLLSTRAGGLGITLTQADAVIFYDNDWNPTMDAQATDRAHRIGRTKDVYVYRLVTKGTIEERILKRAQQKQNVQYTVYSGGFQGDKFKPEEVLKLLFDEQEIDDTVANKFIQKGQKKKKKVLVKKDENSQEVQEDEDMIEVDLNVLEQNEKDMEDAD